MDIVEVLRNVPLTQDGKSYNELHGLDRKGRKAKKYSAKEKVTGLIAVICLIFYFAFTWAFET